jgi:hypothetical protein
MNCSWIFLERVTLQYYRITHQTIRKSCPIFHQAGHQSLWIVAVGLSPTDTFAPFPFAEDFGATDFDLIAKGFQSFALQNF